jgi:hypothetical protein
MNNIHFRKRNQQQARRLADRPACEARGEQCGGEEAGRADP